ncbi:hypothetical protein NLG97_g7418 [Lecanicillium saksenae]|uniref:Uncharacterized protein n=1 Tax=Lecanicillium saksenae TaxID=468837 RepID=A0ACC1QPV2_9HYPO|nr:hypothetical protein NLG97_g7418 [Lecanicillium saksenae]
MVVLYYAATAPINPSSSASPSLSAAQVWAGLRHKVRHADQFVSSITSCVVDSERGNVVQRRVVVDGSSVETKETCTELAPHKVEYKLEDGTEIVNIVAAGPSGEEDECYLTYSFKWQFPDIKEGSDEEKKMLAEQQKMAQEAVQATIKSIREMVKDGRIKA